MVKKIETKISMELSQLPGKENKIFVNDIQISGVRAVSLSHAVNSIPQVNLEIIPTKVDVTCFGEVFENWASLEGPSKAKDCLELPLV